MHVLRLLHPGTDGADDVRVQPAVEAPSRSHGSVAIVAREEGQILVLVVALVAVAERVLVRADGAVRRHGRVVGRGEMLSGGHPGHGRIGGLIGVGIGKASGRQRSLCASMEATFTTYLMLRTSGG